MGFSKGSMIYAYAPKELPQNKGTMKDDYPPLARLGCFRPGFFHRNTLAYAFSSRLNKPRVYTPVKEHSNKTCPFPIEIASITMVDVPLLGCKYLLILKNTRVTS